ncbi:MAG: penicillin-binding transpeptidase domain-containing protein [Kofleriaceae bacterium]
MTATTLLFAALRGAIVLGLALAAMPLLRKASAATRRAVLVFALVAVVALPVATALLPSLHLRDAAPSLDPSALIAASSPDPVADPMPLAAASPARAAAAATHAPSEAGTSWAPSPLAIVLALWALGALVVLARLGAGLYRARRIATSARLVEVRQLDIRTHESVAITEMPRVRREARSSLDLGRSRTCSVEIRSSTEIDTPAVTGLFAPVILLPREADTWTDDRRELVIAHELAHVARRDCLASVVAQIAVAMHWFDPLAWLAARRLRIERELAADDRVLDGGATASSYAAHLLALAIGDARDDGAPRAIPAGALAMAEPAQVSVRIRALLSPDHSRTPLGRTRVALLGACGVALAMLVACASPDRAPVPPAIPDAGAREVAAPAAPVAAPASDTIDAAIQAIADEEIDRMVGEWKPRAAVIIVLDPDTGGVLAVANRGGDTAQHAYVTGSTMKPFVIAAAIEEGAIAATDTFDVNNGELAYAGKTIHDASKHRVLDVAGILAVSSNVGLVKIFDKLGGAKLGAWMKRFHLAETAPVIADGSLEGAGIAIGEGLPATPLQLASSFAAIANGGTYRAPTHAKAATAGERVVSQKTANAVLAMLENVVAGENGTGKAARLEGVRVAGKTGTAGLSKDHARGYYASFVGTAPIEKPRFVVLVAAEAPRDNGTGGRVAAPVFARVLTRVLALRP